MSKNISKGDLRKQDFLVLKQSRDDTVTNVVAPNGLQIGLTDNRFRNPLTVKGSTIGEGGITGSLTQLVDGTPYLKAGQNITITTGSTGQIVISNDIAAVAVRRNKQQYQIVSPDLAGTAISLTNSAFNSIGVTDTDDFIDVYHNNVLLLSGSVSEVTAGTKDYYIDRLNNTAVFGFDLAINDTVITSVISSGSAQLAAAGDALSLTSNTYNVNVGSTGGIQITSDALALKFKSAGGLSSDSSGVFVDINNQADLGASVATGDFVLVYDVTDGSIKKVSVGNIQGSGATIDIAGVSNSLTETTLATGDLFAVADIDAANETKKITVRDYGQYLASTSNSGIDGGTGKLTLDINDLSAAVVDVSADSIAIVDASDNTTKKESISDLVAKFAGTVTDTGLAASSGVLSLDITNQTSVGTISTSDEIIIYDVDASALKKATINDLQAGSAAPPGAQYVTLALDGTLSDERVLTAGDGLDLTDGGAGGNATLAVDVTDFIDNNYGLTESANNIRVALKSSGGLTLDSGEIKVDYGTSSGLAAAGSNDVTIVAGDGLKSGGSFKVGASSSTVQLDIKPSDFAGNGLKVNSDDLVVSLGAGSNISITTGSDGSFIISSSTGADGIYTAGDGLDLNSQEFSVDLKSGGGLKIDSTELAVEVDDFIGNGLQNDGSDNIAVKPNTVQGAGYAPVHVNTNGVSVRYDNTTIGASGTGTLEVKDGAITADKLQNSSLTVAAGDGLRNGGSVALGSSVQLDINPTDFAGTGLKADGAFNLLIDDSIVATLTGSAFRGDVEVTGTLDVVYGLTALSVKSNKISGSLTTLTNGDPYLKAGTGISLSTGSDGSVTIVGNVGDITGVTAGTGLTGGGDTGTVTLNVDDSIVATLTGSVFSGHVGVTGSLHSTAEVSGSILKAGKISGSLTTLENGNPYLLAGSGISLATGSDGSVTITGNVGDITAVNVGTGLSGGGNTGDVTVSIDDSVVATLSGSVFSGHVGVTGSIHSTAEVSGSLLKASALSGSLTTLENGNPYLLAGTGISIATGSDGAVTITGNVGDITGVTAGTGLSGGGDTGTVSLRVDDSVVATLTSSANFSNGISGSLTQLSDGSSFIIAGNNISVTSASNGAITIGASDTLFTAGTGLQLDGTEFSINDAVVATLSGSVFSGHVGVTGSIHSTSEISGSILKAGKISGSLTTLENGNPYLLAGSGISLATGSDGSVTITGNVGDITGVTAGTGLSGGGDTGTVTLNIDDSVVATLTSSAAFSNGLSGSLTQLADGTSYIIAGENVTVSSASNGAVTIASSFTNTEYTAGDGLDLTSTEFSLDLKGGSGLVIDSTELSIDDSILATISGSVFSGHVGVTGSIHSTAEVSGSILRAPALTGSLTKLEDGSSYIIAGTNVQVVTGSSGSITVSSTDTNTEYTAGAGLDLGGTEFSLDLKSGSGLVIDSTELSIDDSILATISGSVFSGHVGVTGSIHSTAEISGSILRSPAISGSLTHLEDGSSYLVAGANVQIATGSSGAVTISSTDTNTEYTAGDGLDLTGTEFSLDLKSNSGLIIDSTELSIDDSILATISGSVFSGHVGVTGSIHSTVEVKSPKLSGSLTTLENGNPYLLAGSGISLLTGSDGSVTITGNVGDITGVTAGTGLSGGGDTGTVTLNVDDSVVATLTSSVSFSNGISGSLTRLSDGTSYIVAGSNVSVTSASNGAITIASSFTNTEYTAGTGLNLDGTQFDIDDSVVATLSGSVFSGHVGVTGSIHSTVEVKAPKLSGSLTTLKNGNPYLKAGTDIVLTTGSDGSVTIAGDFRQNTPGAPVNSVQFNTSGDFDGDSDFVYDSSSNDLVLSGTINVLTTSLRTADFANKIDVIAPSSLSADYTLTLPSNNGDGNQLLKTDGNGNLSFDFTDRVFVDVRNGSGGSLTKGTPVHVSGYHASTRKPLIIAARASDTDDMPALGILAEDLPTANSEGKVCISGYLGGLNTNPFSVADTLYVASSGGLTSTKPTGANDVIQVIGVCVSDSLSNGIILVKNAATIDNPNTVTATGGLSGSLTHLADGSSYLIAGNNITIVTGSNGAITISSTGSNGVAGNPGGSNTQVQFNDNGSFGASSSFTFDSSAESLNVTNLSGSLTHLSDGSSYLIAGSNVTIATGSSGAVTISSTGGGSTIGDAEDGTYEDGIFTDFVPSTPTGTAIDRFNELFRLMAPAPAPDLDNIDVDTSDGITAFLSFGSSNDQFSAIPSYASSSVEAGFSAVDVNGSYGPSTSGENIRKGIYDKTSVISGTLNEDVAIAQHNSGVTNHVANAFGNANEGTLQLFVNDALVHSVDLSQASAGTGVPGSGTGSQLNSNGSGFVTLSQTGSAVQSTGVSFDTFQHRTGQFQVGTADQRNGWNYAQVVHAIGGNSVTTNFVEWINDDDSSALSAAGNSINFTGSGSIHLSGVEYFASGTVEYRANVSNAYKYIYDNNPISFSVANSAFSQNNTNFSLANQAKPTIDTGSGEDHAKVLHVTSSATISADYFLSGTVTAGINVTHPRKSDLSNAGQSTTAPVLMYNLSNTSTDLSETFRRENFRLISGSYDSQSDVTSVSNAWNSEVYMTASNGGHSNGLQFFNERLLSPINTINLGNFSSFSNGPAQNPDYSGETGTRTFHRWFKNTTGSDQFDLSLALQGSGTIVSHGTALDASTISVLVKLPGKTGWMDVAGTFELDSVADNDGASAVTTVISKDLTLNATNYVNFGNISIENNQYVLVCIKADESWTGHISNITVVVGAGTGTLTPVPDLDDIECDQDGTDVNLSFGAAKPITDYSSPATAAGFTAADLNDLYQTAETSNNLRKAVFNGATTLEGQLNADIDSPGNDHVAFAFSDANTGSLKLEVNGVVIHEVEITGSSTLVGAGEPGAPGTGESLNSDGSGFIALSNWGPGLFDNGVPRYSEIQRTSKYRIVSSSQRDGWNYARVIHQGTWGTRTTNFIEWIVDANSEAMASEGNGLSIFGDDSHSFLSGVKYFNSPSGSILTRVSNIYKNVYSDSTSAISFTALLNATASKLIQSGSGLSSTKTTNSNTDSLQTLSTATDSQNELLHVSGTIDFTRSKSLPGTYTTAFNCAGALVFDHPFKTNLTIPTQTTTNLLVWTPSDTSNANTDEFFTGEAYRLVSGSYTAQSDVSGGTKDWNSQTSMNDQSSYPEHATGLLIYDTYLIPPKDGGSNGDFRNHDEGGGIESPAGNVNYNSLTNSTRDYFRSFLNNTTNDRPSVQITLYGDANIVGRVGPNSGTLGSNKNIFVEVGIPGKTGFLDLARPSAGSGNYNEGDGCLSGDLTATVGSGGVTNTATFNGRTVDGTVSGAEYLVIRISASKDWTGYLDRISVSWS